jgi:hypothetical protein
MGGGSLCREDWGIQILHSIQSPCLIADFGEGIVIKKEFLNYRDGRT